MSLRYKHVQKLTFNHKWVSEAVVKYTALLATIRLSRNALRVFISSSNLDKYYGFLSPF